MKTGRPRKNKKELKIACSIRIQRKTMDTIKKKYKTIQKFIDFILQNQKIM